MQKPTINTYGHWLSANPSKNYVLHLLRHDIERINPSRSLDAGAGELRNYWMFPGKYVGISHNKAAYIKGLRRGFNPKLIAEKGLPEVYLMRLESDFSFLGLFDLCVCTYTISYIEKRAEVVRRLAERVARGGALILQDELSWLDRYLAVLSELFEAVDVVYCARHGSDVMCDDMPKLANAPPSPRFNELLEAEMRAPNTPAGHAAFYLRATGKKAANADTPPPPEMVVEGGLHIVKNDIPFLKATT